MSPREDKSVTTTAGNDVEMLLTQRRSVWCIPAGLSAIRGLQSSARRLRQCQLMSLVLLLVIFEISMGFSGPSATANNEKDMQLWYSLLRMSMKNDTNSTATQRLGQPARSSRSQSTATKLADDASHSVMVIFTSDVHGHVRRKCRGASCYPGASSLASAVRTVRRAAASGDTKVLLIDIGDAFFGSSDANETVVGEIMNMLEYDAMVLGNHERDIGPNRLDGFATQVNFPILAANADGPHWMQKYLRVDLGGGMNLCLIGSTTDDENPLAGDNLTLSSPETFVVEYASQLRSNRSCDHVIILSHAGIGVDKIIASNSTDVVDAIFGGHSHVLMGVTADAKPESDEFGEVLNLPFPFRANGTGTPVAHVGSYGRYMGLVHLEWMGSKLTRIEGNLVPLDERHGVVPAEDVDVWLSEHPSLSYMGYHTHFKVVDSGIDNVCGFVCRKQECLLGNLVTDAMRSCVERGSCASFVDESHKHLPIIALIESGTLRDCPTSIGDEDFSSILPWPNTLVLMAVSGATLHKMLEHGVKTQEENGGGFLQASGLNYQYRHSAVINASITVGYDHNSSKSSNVSVVTMSTKPNRCATESLDALLVEPISVDKMYLVVVTDWLAAGGDGFGEAIQSANATPTNATLRETLLWHASFSPHVQREGRSCFIPVDLPPSVSTHPVSGFVAGYVAFFALYPLYTLFVRKSTNGKEKAKCGFGLFKGVWIGSLATALCQCIYFLIYDMDALFGYSPFVRSSLGSILTCISTNPFWVVVTRVQTSELSIDQAIRIVKKERGWQGFFDGVLMNLVMCVFPVVRQVVMEALLATSSFGTSSSHVAVAAGIGACAATTVTLPIQRWRVRLQQGMSVRAAVTFGTDCCDGLAFQFLHSSLSSIVLFVVKCNLDDLIFMVPLTD